MSTAGNQRITRSASKARSTGAGSIGAPSVGAPSRARSRRGGSAAPLAEEDKPAVGNQVTRAYGTEGKSAQAQLLSTQIGMNQAVNPIANAVSRAQAPETPNVGTPIADSPVANAPGRLPALPEEPENGEGSGQRYPVLNQGFNFDPRPERRPYSIDSDESDESEPPAQTSFFSRHFWGPRRVGFNAEGPNRTANNVMAARRQIYGRYAHEGIGPFGIQLSWSWAVFMRDLVVAFALMFAIMWMYELNRTALFILGGVEPGISQDVNMSSPMFQLLHNRVATVEQHVQDLSLGSTSVDAAAAKYRINWFTPGFGTMIDLYLSSPTLLICDPTWIPEGWPWSMFTSQMCPQVPASVPHFAALKPWSDPVEDSWCAPPSNGKLQLTVILSRTITPTELVVEHAAMDEMPTGFMGSSPREVELWIHVPDDRVRAALLEEISHNTPSLLEDSSPQGKTLSNNQALPVDYVPVGRWEYDIRTNQRLQTFPLSLPLGHYGVSTSKVAVRVNSNWGNVKFTCLSRLRLYGEDTSGFKEKLDGDMASAM